MRRRPTGLLRDGQQHELMWNLQNKNPSPFRAERSASEVEAGRGVDVKEFRGCYRIVTLSSH